ncbi:protein of unknown function [Caballeronia sp. S22]
MQRCPERRESSLEPVTFGSAFDDAGGIVVALQRKQLIEAYASQLRKEPSELQPLMPSLIMESARRHQCLQAAGFCPSFANR